MFSYKPSEEVLQELRKVRLVGVVGPSGSGKTTLLRQAAARDPELQVVVSDVSRPKRPEERDGVDYFFRDKQSMLDAIERREYVQVASSNSGDFYATHIQSYPQHGLAVLTIWADAIPVFQKLPFKNMRVIFVVPPSFVVWQERLGLHDFAPVFQQKRLAEARRSFAFALATPGVQFVINDELHRATADFIELAHGRTNSHLQTMQLPARQTIENILHKLPK